MNYSQPGAFSWHDDGTQTGLTARFEEEIRKDREQRQAARDATEGADAAPNVPGSIPAADPRPRP